MKRILLINLVLVFLTGCTALQQDDTGYYERLTTAINSSIDAQQQATGKIIESLRESNTISAEKLGKIEAQIVKADEYVDVAQLAAAEAAKVYEEKQGEDKTIALIEAARRANEVSAPVNPYAPLIEGGLAIATALAGGYGILKKKEATTVGKKYDAHKKAAEKLMREGSTDEAKKIYDTIGAERAKVAIS